MVAADVLMPIADLFFSKYNLVMVIGSHAQGWDFPDQNPFFPSKMG